LTAKNAENSKKRGEDKREQGICCSVLAFSAFFAVIAVDVDRVERWIMPMDAGRFVAVVVLAALVAGCGEREATQNAPGHAPVAARGSATTGSAATGPATRAATTRGWGPMQYQPFHGVNPQNVYLPATRPMTAPADDSRLVPSDDLTW
jgi:hypothetical protein